MNWGPSEEHKIIFVIYKPFYTKSLGISLAEFKNKLHKLVLTVSMIETIQKY